MFNMGESLILSFFFIRVSDVIIESLSFTYSANGKRQIQTENEQIKTAQKILMDKKLL